MRTRPNFMVSRYNRWIKRRGPERKKQMVWVIPAKEKPNFLANFGEGNGKKCGRVWVGEMPLFWGSSTAAHTIWGGLGERSNDRCKLQTRFIPKKYILLLLAYSLGGCLMAIPFRYYPKFYPTPSVHHRATDYTHHITTLLK